MRAVIQTDIGALVLDTITAKRLIRDIESQIPGAKTLPIITQSMLDAGIEATHLNLGYPKRFLDSELIGIVKRVYTAMRVLE